MRDLFIRSFERVINVFIILAAIAALVAAANAPSFWQGLLALLFVLAFGALYLVLIGGAMYAAIGIYHNTLRTAEALERRTGPL